MAKFEKVSRFNDVDLPMPARGTVNSAGYDLIVAEDTFVPSIWSQLNILRDAADERNELDLAAVKKLVKETSVKPTLVSTGMKCQLESNRYLELSVRSSTPLKYWLVLANGIGIIDADYYNNPDNEGEIFLQLINLFPADIQLHRGDKLGQAIIKSYGITEDDVCLTKRTGGFGSTGV